jgi:hypothetical protein
MYGRWQIGALPPDEYVRKAREFAKVMKWTDPSIELISCGEVGWTDWDRIVVDGLASQVDYHSVHIYTGSPDYYANVFAPHQADRALRICEAYIEKARYEQKIARPIHIAYDEWNVWYRQRGRDSGLEERYDLSDALAVASYLNVFVRHCRSVKIANLAQLVNVIAPIFTRPDGLFLQTIYHPLRLYAEHLREVALDVAVECEARELSPDEELRGRSAQHKVADLSPPPLPRRRRDLRRGRPGAHDRGRQPPPRRGDRGDRSSRRCDRPARPSLRRERPRSVGDELVRGAGGGRRGRAGGRGGRRRAALELSGPFGHGAGPGRLGRRRSGRLQERGVGGAELPGQAAGGQRLAAAGVRPGQEGAAAAGQAEAGGATALGRGRLDHAAAGPDRAVTGVAARGGG